MNARAWRRVRPVLLRDRLTLTVSVVVAVTVSAFVIATDLAFGAFQHRQVRDLAQREATRAQEIVLAGTPGEAFVRSAGEVRLQFVGRNGSVLVPDPAQTPLPATTEPTVLRDPVPDADGRWVITAVPWRTPAGTEAGTVRVAISLAGADRDRATLRTVLLSIGAVLLLLAALAGAWAVRRGLRPLSDLALAARAVDPADPRPVRHRGPHDEVAQLADGLNRALDGIRARRDAERERLADVAHELAAPVTVIAGHLRHLSDPDAASGTEDDRRRLASARTAAEDLLHASEDLLTLARGDLDQRLSWEVTDAGRLAHDVAGAWRGVDVQVAPGDLRVVVDPVRMRQVIRNLIRNAVRAATSPHGVQVRVAAEGDEVLIRVRDDGPGLDAAAREAIFGRYVTGSGGAGLGLAVVRRLVDAMDGHVRATSGGETDAAGALFEVRLPCADRAFGPDPDLDEP
ncbi:MAG: HAMP domain-containing sensor histidine kinase [Trueperaceae bacterium]